MSNKRDYTAEEWQLLLDVPAAVGTAVMQAGKSGIGSIKEAMALASGILGARKGYEGVELVEALVNARIENGEKSTIETFSSPYRELTPDQICEDALEKCRAAVLILDAKATSEEKTRYLDWSISLAERVANAAKEGGFLGIGGERVSQEEKDVIAAVRAAFGQ